MLHTASPALRTNNDSLEMFNADTNITALLSILITIFHAHYEKYFLMNRVCQSL